MKTFLYALSGLLLGAGLALGVALLVVWMDHVPSNSGGREMEIIFVWMPLGSILGLIAGVILRIRRQ